MNKTITFLAIALLTVPTCLLGAQDKNLESVLLEAASAGQTDIVKSFLDKGANIEVKNELGATPLIFASAKGQSQVVALLLDGGAKVNAKTTTGITPLIAAASGGYAEIVKLLLAKGADVCAKEQQGRTALSMAEASGHSEVTDLLKSAEKSCAPEEPRVASRDASYSRQRSVETSGSANSETSEPMPDLTQGSGESPAGQQSGPVGAALNDPIIGPILSQVLGGQQSDPGQVAALQNPQQLPANAGPAPAPSAATTVTANPDGSTTTVTKNPDKSTTTVTKNPDKSTTTETKKTDGSTTTVTKVPGALGGTAVVNKDKTGAGTFTNFDANGKQRITATFDENTKTFSSTSFDSNGKITSTSTSDGKTTVDTKFGPDGRPTSRDTTDVATNKTTTVQCDAPGKCPVGPHQADTLKANTKPEGLTGAKDKPKADVSGKTKNNLGGNDHKGLHANKLQGLAVQKQGLTGANKEKVKAEVLGQIEGKPNVDNKGANKQFDNKFRTDSNKKNRKEYFSKSATSLGSNVKENVNTQKEFNKFSEGSKHKPKVNTVEQFKSKSKGQWGSSAGSQGAVKHHPYEKPQVNR